MRNNTFLSLCLLILTTLPSFAQQASSNSNAQPLSSGQVTGESETATGNPPLQIRSHDYWDGDEPGVAWLILHPFASKQFVRRYTQTIQDRVSELNDLTASNSKSLGDVDLRAQQGIQIVSGKADLADQHAQDASTEAETASQSALALNTRLSTLESTVAGMDEYRCTTQTEIRFRPGQTELSKGAKYALGQLAVQVKDQPNSIVEVRGFASGQGQAAISNSRELADSVVRYMVFNQEIPAHRIYVVGMGNVPGETGTSPIRVEISFLAHK